MRRRSRLLRIAKWGGVVACALVIAVWVLSIRFPGRAARDDLIFSTSGGCATISFYQLSGDPIAVALYRQNINRSVIQHGLDWRKLSSYGLSLPAIRKFDIRDALVYRAPQLRLTGRAALAGRFNWTSIDVSIPYWSILAVIGLPTMLAWRLDRRRKPGHCPCGYDLTGNVSDICPECGTNIRADVLAEEYRGRLP